jgi:hypothetical protein
MLRYLEKVTKVKPEDLNTVLTNDPAGCAVFEFRSRSRRAWRYDFLRHVRTKFPINRITAIPELCSIDKAELEGLEVRVDALACQV